MTIDNLNHGNESGTTLISAKEATTNLTKHVSFAKGTIDPSTNKDGKNTLKTAANRNALQSAEKNGIPVALEANK
jgi:hypothetical protein